MKFCPDRLWHNSTARKLLVVVPGTTGIGFPTKKGFYHIASSLWTSNISIYFANTCGQDGRRGVLDMTRWANGVIAEASELMASYTFDRIDFLGTCLGGPIAARSHQSISSGKLFLWECAPIYTDAHKQDFVCYCDLNGIKTSKRFWDHLDNLEDVLPADSLATFYHGSSSQLPFNQADLNRAKKQYPKWRFKEFSDAAHGLVRSSSILPLSNLCQDLIATIHQNK